MKQTHSPITARNGAGLTVEELKKMTAQRMAQQHSQSPTPPRIYQRPDVSHQHVLRGNYAAASSGPSAMDDRLMSRGTPPPKHRPHKPAEVKPAKPQEPAMPHGLTVQELKELTRIRLEREALEKRSAGGSPFTDLRSESSASDTDSMTKTHVGRNAATYFTSSIPARASPIIGRTVQHNIPHPIPKVGVPVIAFGEKSCDKKAELHQLSRGPSGISDTSSTRSVSSSSSDATPDCMPNSTMVILPVPANGTWNLAADTHLFRPAAEDPRSSVIGNTIRQIMTLDVSNGSDGFHMPEPPPPPEGVFGPSDNPLSPRSLKNRPQIPVECPEEIRRRSRSDCLAHEMAEAVLDTPPGSPGQSSVGRKRMSGGRGSLMSLTGSISPPSNSAVLDSSVPDESFFRRSDSDDSLPSSNVLGNNIFRRSNSARRGPTENSFNNSGVMSYFGGLSQTNESSPFFAKLGNGSNTILSFYQNMGQDAAPVDAFSPHDKICPIDNGQDTISKDFSLKNKTTN